LLKAGVPVAARILVIANIPAVACFHAVAGVLKLVFDSVALSHFHSQKFSIDFKTFKTATFLESSCDDSHLAPLGVTIVM
jgi:hypothetical protein